MKPFSISDFSLINTILKVGPTQLDVTNSLLSEQIIGMAFLFIQQVILSCYRQKPHAMCIRQPFPEKELAKSLPRSRARKASLTISPRSTTSDI